MIRCEYAAHNHVFIIAILKLAHEKRKYQGQDVLARTARRSANMTRNPGAIRLKCADTYNKTKKHRNSPAQLCSLAKLGENLRFVAFMHAVVGLQ